MKLMKRGSQLWWIVVALVALGLVVDAQQPGEIGGAGAGTRGAAVAPGRAQGEAYNAPRPPVPAAVVAHGQEVFSANCSFCHGDDARGGSVGPNLIRNQVVLDDQNGELIEPVVHGSRQAEGMPKLNLSDPDIVAVAAWLHSQPLGNRGAPSTLDIVVGNAQAGEAYFNGAGKCSTCHSVTGDLAGIGGKYSAKTLQNAIVSGRAGSGGGAGGAGETVTVTLAGQKVEGRLDHLDAFIVSLTEKDGTHRSFDINDGEPQVVVHDPLQAHIDMLRTWKNSDLHNLTAYLTTLK
jgi:cytochrome c oxidase cbb3-type subunit III